MLWQVLDHLPPGSQSEVTDRIKRDPNLYSTRGRSMTAVLFVLSEIDSKRTNSIIKFGDLKIVGTFPPKLGKLWLIIWSVVSNHLKNSNKKLHSSRGEHWTHVWNQESSPKTPCEKIVESIQNHHPAIYNPDTDSILIMYLKTAGNLGHFRNDYQCIHLFHHDGRWWLFKWMYLISSSMESNDPTEDWRYVLVIYHTLPSLKLT